MARTRKDRPWWVTNADLKTRVGEDHNCGRLGAVCDIGDKHVAGRYQTCFYFAADEFGRSQYEPRDPTKSERKAGYWAPERSGVRKVMTRFEKAAAVGPVDDSRAPVEQHRHASHGHWWWD